METKDLVKYWEDSGLLTYIDNEEDKKVLAESLERASKDPVILYSQKYGEMAQHMLFPIIRRLMVKFGFRPIKNVRELYIDISECWEEFIRRDEVMDYDVEAVFCDWYTENEGDGFVEEIK